MKAWKRNAVVATVVLFVCVAVYLNWQYNDSVESLSTAEIGAGQSLGDVELASSPGPDSLGDAIGGHSSYFDSARLERQQARDSVVELLNIASASTETTQEARDSASKEIRLLADTVMKESRIEGLIKAKGFIDCVAYISDTGINVVVSTENGNITTTDVARIKDIVIGETNLTTEKIKIVPPGGSTGADSAPAASPNPATTPTATPAAS